MKRLPFFLRLLLLLACGMALAKAAPDGYTLLMHNITFPVSSVALMNQFRPIIRNMKLEN